MRSRPRRPPTRSGNEFVGIFGTGLLVFAFITAFVSAFIINNVFQITIGQRLANSRCSAPSARRVARSAG